MSAVRDPGLQPERTALAWQRTAVGFVGAALLFLRWSAQHGPVVVGVTTLAAVVAGWTFAHTRRRLRRATGSSGRVPLAPATTEVLVLTTGTALLALTALGIALTT